MSVESQERAAYERIATKSDLAALESRMTWRLIAVGVFAIAAITVIDRLWG